MTHFFGVFIKKDKSVAQNLSQIKGVNSKQVLKICQETSILPRTPWIWLTDTQIIVLQKWIETNLLVSVELERVSKGRLYFLISIGSYRGTRFRKGLPCRGQRTKTNSKTSKIIKKQL